MDPRPHRRLDKLQKIATSLMGGMVLVTFIASNLHAVLWQSSEWLVSAVLPAVVIDLTNNERIDNSAAPLRRNETLDAAAKLKAQHMAENEYFSHHSPEGISPWHWFNEAGYVYAHAGENLAIHFTDSAEVVEAWMDSPTHRKNIVDQKFTEIGVGTAKGEFDGYNTVYVVQLFGAPAVSPVPIEAAQDGVPELEPELLTQVEPEPVLIEVVPNTPVVTNVESLQVAGLEDRDQVSKPLSATLESESVADEVVVLESYLESETELVEDKQTQATKTPVSIDEIAVAMQPSAAEVPSMLQEYESIEDEQVREVDPPATSPSDIVVVESLTISTSSGLMVAQIEGDQSHAGYTFATIATQPNRLLEFMYITLGLVALLLISTSIFIEVRRMQYRQVVYGVAMLFVMSGLWFFHAWLTGGAVIV